MDKIQNNENLLSNIEQILTTVENYVENCFAKQDMEMFIEARQPKSIEDVEAFSKEYFNRKNWIF